MMSSVFNPVFGAANGIDGDYSSIIASTSAESADQWLSARADLSSGASIGYVAVYNRNDGYAQDMLSPYEVWLGSSYGAQEYSCGGSISVPAVTGPFTTWCGGGGAGLDYVTVVIRAGRARWLMIAEIEMYAA